MENSEYFKVTKDAMRRKPTRRWLANGAWLVGGLIILLVSTLTFFGIALGPRDEDYCNTIPNAPEITGTYRWEVERKSVLPLSYECTYYTEDGAILTATSDAGDSQRAAIILPTLYLFGYMMWLVIVTRKARGRALTGEVIVEPGSRP